MDTSGYLPQLSDDDPLFEVAEYTQLMKTKLNDDKSMVFKNAGFLWGTGTWDAGPLTADTSGASLSQRTTTPTQTFASPGSINGSLKFNETGIYFVEWIVVCAADPGNAGYRINFYGTWPGSPTGVDTIIGQATHPAGVLYWESVITTYVRVPTTGLEIRFTGNQANSTTNAAKVRVVKTGNF